MKEPWLWLGCVRFRRDLEKQITADRGLRKAGRMWLGLNVPAPHLHTISPGSAVAARRWIPGSLVGMGVVIYLSHPTGARSLQGEIIH